MPERPKELSDLLTAKALYRRDKYQARMERHSPRRASALPGFTKHTSAPRKKAPAPASGVLAVASRIATLAASDVRTRYHELVDKNLENGLTALERFELERIEIRLDAEDRDPKIEALDRQWESERSELLNSIHHLLSRLRK